MVFYKIIEYISQIHAINIHDYKSIHSKLLLNAMFLKISNLIYNYILIEITGITCAKHCLIPFYVIHTMFCKTKIVGIVQRTSLIDSKRITFFQFSRFVII